MSNSLSLFDPAEQPETHRAFVPRFPIFYPFPTVKASLFRRTINGITCTYSGADGENVPYTQTDRIWLEAITTQAVKQKPHDLEHINSNDTVIELGRVSAALRQAGISREGKRIEAARYSILRIHRLNVDIKGTSHNNVYRRLLGDSFRIGEGKFVLTWASRAADDDAQPELPGMNCIRLSKGFCLSIWKGGAIPVVHEHYISLHGPRQQDVYLWLSLRLFNLQEPADIERDSLLEQFHGHVVNPARRRILWSEFKHDLYYIKSTYYNQADIKLTDTGIRLLPSPPLIEPNDRRAGHIPFIR